MTNITDDPMLTAIMAFVGAMCDVAVAEATGFHNSGVCEIRRDAAKTQFVKEMNAITDDKEG